MLPGIISRAGRSSAVLLLCLAVLTGPAVKANIDVAQSSQILEQFAGSPITNFQGFLEQLESEPVAKSANADIAIGKYLDSETLSDEESHVIQRLLGLYTRLKYGDEALRNLTRLVAVPTFTVEGLPQHENPEFHRMAELIREIAEEFNLTFRNIDQRVYEVSLDGAGDELVGFHAHADVVPVNPALWVLDDGTHLDPFKVTRIGNRLYGRGTEDDKNGIIVALYAMRVIKEEHLPLMRDFKLLIDTTEETLGNAIPYYFERNPTPDYNLALDGGYPVIIAEKGYGVVTAHFPVRRGSGEGGEIISLTGGLAYNQIPSTSTAVIASRSPDDLVDLLNREGAAYVLAHGGDFRITALADGQRVQLNVKGVSAHSSDPASGVNPVSRMLDFIHSLDGRQVFKGNHITDAARYAAENWGLDYFGNTMGIAYSDDFMGPLTTALTFVALDDNELRLSVNLRMPVGKTPQVLQREIASHLDAWQAASGVQVSFEFNQMGEPMYRNPEGKWVNALLDVAAENLGIPREFRSSAGGTSVHDLPNGVQFGLAMPGVKYTGHNANEFKTIDQFLIDLQIVTEMMARIGGMPEL